MSTMPRRKSGSSWQNARHKTGVTLGDDGLAGLFVDELAAQVSDHRGGELTRNPVEVGKCSFDASGNLQCRPPREPVKIH